jgi:hypothetical protein
MAAYSGIVKAHLVTMGSNWSDYSRPVEAFSEAKAHSGATKIHSGNLDPWKLGEWLQKLMLTNGLKVTTISKMKPL